jgi:hypothetical protein
MTTDRFMVDFLSGCFEQRSRIYLDRRFALISAADWLSGRVVFADATIIFGRVPGMRLGRVGSDSELLE